MKFIHINLPIEDKSKSLIEEDSERHCYEGWPLWFPVVQVHWNQLVYIIGEGLRV